MKILFWRTAALVACLGLLLTQSARAEREYQIASDAAESAGDSLVSYNSIDTADYDETDSGNVEKVGYLSGGNGNGLGMSRGLGFLDRPGQFFFGAEYIYARASFSEAFAYTVRDNNAPENGVQFVEYDFDYSPSYRFYGGFRVPDCGCEIVFDHARYQSSATANVVQAANEIVNGGYEINGTQNNFADVDIQSYGVGIARTIPLGGCYCKCDPCCGDPCCGDTCCGDDCCGDTCCDSGCDCGDSCGCGTGCGWCPFWDITWSAGVRFADVGWGRNSVGNAGTPTAPVIDLTANTQLNFEGVGLRTGLLGRRYFGRKRLASIYAKGDISLLVGNMSINTITQDVLNVQAPVISHRNSARRVIPVTEIEVGGSIHASRNITLSSGYFISAWHDLGMRDTYDFNGAFQLSHYDDANILGFDGFFARAEIAY